jgi:hypothetical protein
VAARKQQRPARPRRSQQEPDRLRLVSATRDKLGLVWPSVTNVRSWRVVCWDGRDKPVALLTLTSEHRRATLAGLRQLPSPFTVAVSGLDSDGAVVWQDGLADLTPGDSDQERRGIMPAKKTKKAADEKAAATGKPRPKKKTSRGK